MSLWLGDQDAPELLKSKGSREKTRTRVKRFTVVCERSEIITSVRNVPERNERGRRADADRVKHRLSVRNVPKPRIELLPFLKPLPEADGRQQGVNKLTPQKGLAEMVETCRDCPEIVRNVRPSKGVTRTMTPRRMLTNAKVENIKGVANRYLLATDRKQEGVNETVTPLQGVTKRNPLTGSPKARRP